jgi:hypothetical protein
MDKGVWVFLIWAYPLDSDCVLSKNGELLARITSNAKVLVQPTRDELTVRCEKPGYEPATAVNRFADFEPGQARDGFDFEFGVILKPLPGTKLPEPDIEI